MLTGNIEKLFWPQHIVSAAAFAKRHWSPCKTWSRKSILNWMKWFNDDNRLSIKLDAKSKIRAVGLVRLLNSPPDFKDDYRLEKDGEMLWIDLVVSRTREGIAQLLNDAIERFGRRQFIGFMRSENKEKIKVYDFNNFSKRFLEGKI